MIHSISFNRLGGGTSAAALIFEEEDLMEDIKSLSLDLETYSDVDLGKCGVYRYAESPYFEVLLFGYSVNGGKVHVIDLALR